MPKGEKLTPKQKKFADEYLETWNASEAADQVYNCKNRATAWAIGVENLQKPLIQGYLKDKWEEAGKMIQTLMSTSEKDEVKLNAAKFMYEHAEGKAVQHTDNKHSWSVSVELTEAQKKLIADKYK